MLSAVTSFVQFADTIRPLSRLEYDRLIAMGWFADERIELIEGLLVTMSPQGSAHAALIAHLNELLVRLVGNRALVRPQLPLAVSDDSEPEPDFALVERRNYRAGHPTTALLVIEVADSSMARDRHKARLYAAADVAEYWILDADVETLTIHRKPDPAQPGYRDVETLRSGDRVRLVAFPDIEVSVAELLG